MGKVSEHDVVIARHLARVLTGGDTSPIAPKRTICARSRTRGIPEPVRNGEDASTYGVHPDGRETLAKLSVV